MAERSAIEWTDATWNPITGCSVISAGCTNCYAMKLAGGRMKNHPSRAGLTTSSKAGPVWNGTVRLNEQWLEQPLRWSAPRRIFVCAHSDLFHGDVLDEWIDQVFAIMALAPQHQFQILTKRPGRMVAYMRDRARKLARFMIDRYLLPAADLTSRALTERRRAIDAAWPVASVGDIDDPDDVTMRNWPLPNVWLGVSVEDQRAADERIPQLLATPAAIRFLSAEPLLGPVNLDSWLAPWKACQECDDGEGYGNRCNSDRIPRDEQCPWKRAVQIATEHPPFSDDGMPASTTCDVRTLNWVIVGGESGSGARPMHPDWARGLRDQCAAAGVPFLFKQWGEHSLDYDRDRDDPDWRRCGDQERAHQGQWLNLAGGRGFHGDRVHYAARVGKKAAGRLLDGVQHDGMPAR